MQIPVIVNGKKINKEFDISAKHKVKFENDYGRGVIALTGDSSYTLVKGGILLEEGSELEVAKNCTPFSGLEILVDSFRFDQPLSRNSVRKDESFEDVMTAVENATKELIKNLTERYPEIEKKNIKETELIRQYLHDVLVAGQLSGLPEKIRQLKLFKTVDGKFISYRNIVSSGTFEGTIYYSNRKYNSNEIKYFTKRNIPVLHEPEETIKYFHRTYRFGYQNLTQGLLIEGLTNGKINHSFEAYADRFTSTLEHFAFFMRRISADSSSGNGCGNNSGYNVNIGSFIKSCMGVSDDDTNNKACDWNGIKELSFDSFVNLSGKPIRRELLYWFRNDGRVILNIHNPYVELMIKLSETDSKLALYYILCEVANSKEIFPFADHRTVEDCIVNIGKNLVKYENEHR